MAIENPIRNRVLAALPKSLRLTVLANCETVSLRMGDVIHAANQPVKYVYFVESGVVSLLAAADDQFVEIAMIGFEGAAGCMSATGSEGIALARTQVQVAGDAYRMSAKKFLAQARSSTAFKREVDAMTSSIVLQVVRNAAIGRFQSVEARLARRLLMLQDRTGEKALRVTQDALGTLIAERRVAISAAASSLKRRKLIDYRRGLLTITSRAGLELATNGCYSDLDRLKASL